VGHAEIVGSRMTDSNGNGLSVFFEISQQIQIAGPHDTAKLTASMILDTAARCHNQQSRFFAGILSPPPNDRRAQSG
jgi:hypothetical protein